VGRGDVSPWESALILLPGRIHRVFNFEQQPSAELQTPFRPRLRDPIKPSHTTTHSHASVIGLVRTQGASMKRVCGGLI
jgi:hypothetical protein